MFGVLPGDQVCFDTQGNCHDSPDLRSPVSSRGCDGACNFSLLGTVEHFLIDMPLIPIALTALLVKYAIEAK